MPEGPEIRRAADALNQALAGHTLTEAWFAFPHLQAQRPRLLGAEVLGITSRGKALLTDFSSGLTLYSHNQLYGRWEIGRPGETLLPTRSPRVRLESAETAAVLYSASDIELLPSEEIESHPFLQRIGPDVLDEKLTPEQVVARLQEPRFARRRLGALLLDQAFLAGLGNYLRAEILWQAQLGPDRRPVDLSPAALAALGEATLDVPYRSYTTRGRTGPDAPEGHHGATFRFQVFRRDGQPCPRCGTAVEKIASASRPLYLCPACQT